MLFICIPGQAIHEAPPGIAKMVGKRSKYAARLLADAIRSNKLKVPPTVKSYYTKNPGMLLVVLVSLVVICFRSEYKRSHSRVAQKITDAIDAACRRADGALSLSLTVLNDVTQTRACFRIGRFPTRCGKSWMTLLARSVVS